MKRYFALFLVLIMSLSLAACGGQQDNNVVRTEEVITEDGTVIRHGYNKDDIRISEIATDTEGNIYEHRYDSAGNHIFESATLTDGSYHEFQYDQDGNVIKETHK